jgi:hypothetical protein
MKIFPPESAIIKYLPLLLGLIACFLPDTKHVLNGAGFTTSIYGNYSGWITILLLLSFFGYTFIIHKKQTQIPGMVNLLLGIYLVGFALFRAYLTLTLYSGSSDRSLAWGMEAVANIREGLILLAIAGIWLIIRGLKHRSA